MPEIKDVVLAAEGGPITVMCVVPPEEYVVGNRRYCRFKHPLGTISPMFRTIRDLSVPHALQKDIFFERENKRRAQAGQPQIGTGEMVQLLCKAVDIIVDAGIVYVRSLSGSTTVATRASAQ